MSNRFVKVGDYLEGEDRVIKVTMAYDNYFYAVDVAVKKPRLKVRNREVYYSNNYICHYGLVKTNKKATNKEAV